jgi:hypothetical protein
MCCLHTLAIADCADVMGADTSETKYLMSSQKVIHIYCDSDVNRASSVRQSGVGEANSRPLAGNELVNEGTEVVADLVMVGFMWT